ncbi:hypothetical protein [Streptomyces canus]|uniref:hypothetical protein n=1 Tax=Streptomyces canus TaxID=58343 RepID=UPI002E2A45CA|nr:hypothetical protein [Streptomyces canus]
MLACIRTALLTTIAILRTTDQFHEEAALLHQAWQSLASYNHSGNQLLLVVRTQP